MNVDIGAEAAQFPEKEYINGIAIAVYSSLNFFSTVWENTIFTIMIRLSK
jgi:hypothetical protein